LFSSTLTGKGIPQHNDCDYLFSSVLGFKTVAISITLYAPDRYAWLLYERNPLTRFLLPHGFTHVLVQLAVFTFIRIRYSRVGNTYFIAYRKKAIRRSFNVLVGFVLLTCLLDAANDAIILLAACLAGIQG